jgi:hypothetical protein
MATLFNRLKRNFLLSLLFALNTIMLFAQPGTNWVLGRSVRFTNFHAATPLRMSSNGVMSLLSTVFVSKVGGVSFDGVASPANGTHFSRLSLNYNGTKRDGRRLEIILDGERYPVSLPDWELLPIAQYANTDYNACVTLFGENGTEKYNHIQYHSAFENRLLGMRILQSDIMFEDLPEFYQVFKSNGDYLLGQDEAMPDAQQALKAAIKIQTLLQQYNPGGRQLYQSYVLTDAEVNIQFSTTNNEFKIAGYPYYFFFRYGTDRQTGEDKVVPYYQMISGFRNDYYDLYRMNPLVYDAVTQTMRYAAFFRYVKLHYQGAWLSFLSSIQNIRPMPAVTTPTTMEKK